MAVFVLGTAKKAAHAVLRKTGTASSRTVDAHASTKCILSQSG